MTGPANNDSEIEERLAGLEAQSVVRPAWLSQTFAAMQYRNYRLWFWSQLTSLLGSWMQITAQAYLVYELTQSAVYLGYVGFVSGIPIWLFSLYAGALADRVDRRRLMVLTQIAMMLLALVLAALTYSEVIRPAHILILAFFFGITNAFDAPVRQSFVTEIVERRDLTNAIALNSSMFNAAATVGPAVGGLLYAVFGPALCFGVNALSFLPVICAMAVMKLKPRERRTDHKPMLSQLLEGLRYVQNHSLVRTLTVLVAVVSVCAISFSTLIPAWAVKILHGDATTNGILYTARGIGSMAGALLIASLGRFRQRGVLLLAGAVSYPFFMLILTATESLIPTLVLLAGVGAGMILVMNLANAIIQTETPDELRGRVMGLYSMVFFGLAPLGSLWTGLLAGWFGEKPAVIANAAIALGAALLLCKFAPQVRRA